MTPKGSTAKLIVVLYVLALLPVAATARPDYHQHSPGAGRLLVGMSTALSGPVRALGEAMETGVNAYFDDVNRAGGINGRAVCLIALDDGYDPATAGANTRVLAENPKILAIIGNAGTPTAKVAMPIAVAHRILFFGALTGAGLLRAIPPNRYVINVRASYVQETAAMVDGLLSAGVKPAEIAVFAQNDSYGAAGYGGVVAALKSHGDRAANETIEGVYPRGTLNVERAAITLLESPVSPKAIIMAGATAPSARFIDIAKTAFPGVRLLNLSFVNGSALAKELGEQANDVIVTQVVPPVTSALAIVREYRRSLAAHDPALKPNDVSLEGFLTARIFVAGLRRAGPHPTRQSVVEAMGSIRHLDIGIGFPVSFTRQNHQASNKVWPMVIRNGRFQPLDWASIAVRSPDY